jgi:hypothetical protein
MRNPSQNKTGRKHDVERLGAILRRVAGDPKRVESEKERIELHLFTAARLLLGRDPSRLLANANKSKRPPIMGDRATALDVERLGAILRRVTLKEGGKDEEERRMIAGHLKAACALIVARLSTLAKVG